MSARSTLRDEVLNTLVAAGHPLDYESLSIRIGSPEPSIRVATRQLQINGVVRMANEGNGTPYDRRTWVPVVTAQQPTPATT